MLCCYVSSRKNAVMQLLSRHVEVGGAETDQSELELAFIIDRLHVPTQWIHHAKVLLLNNHLWFYPVAFVFYPSTVVHLYFIYLYLSYLLMGSVEHVRTCKTDLTSMEKRGGRLETCFWIVFNSLIGIHHVFTFFCYLAVYPQHSSKLKIMERTISNWAASLLLIDLHAIFALEKRCGYRL